MSQIICLEREGGHLVFVNVNNIAGFTAMDDLTTMVTVHQPIGNLTNPIRVNANAAEIKKMVNG